MSDAIVKHISHSVDLNEPVKKTYIDTLLATEDNLAHCFDIALKKGGDSVAMPTGATVTSYFIRYSDNATVPIKNGSINGNVASVTLTKTCYNKPGQFAIIIKVTADGIINTVFYGEGTIFASSTDTVVDEENVIPSLSDLLAQIATMEAATNKANTATANANTAANNANAKAEAAQTATNNADTATSKANTATDNANSAAAKIDGMTVSAVKADKAGATISEVDGVKHIYFELPKGDTGETPNITFKVATGAAGTDVQIEQSGTAENQEVKLTIPRGDTGAVEGIDYYEGTPEALGTASPGDANGLARGDHVHPMPTAEEVGALPKDGTSKDSEKLGGQMPSHYATAESVNQLSQQKADKAGWTPNKIIGTDAGGNMATVDLPEGSGGDADTLGGVAAAEYAQKILISDAYDASSSYNSGDYCIRNNTLYKCLKDNVTGIEVTNTTYWKAVAVSDEIAANERLRKLDSISVDDTKIPLSDVTSLLARACAVISEMKNAAGIEGQRRTGLFSCSLADGTQTGFYYSHVGASIFSFKIGDVASASLRVYFTADAGTTWSQS